MNEDFSTDSEIQAPPVLDGAPETAPLPRSMTGWVVLTLLFAALVLLNLWSYLGRDSKPGALNNELDVRLRSIVASKALGESTKNPDIKKSIDTQLEDLVAEVVGKKGSERNAALFYAAARTEQGKAVTVNDVAFLRKGDDASKAFAELYTNLKLDEKAARELGKKLPERGFVYKLAVVQALERLKVPNARDELVSPAKALLMALGGLILGVVLLGGMVLVSLYVTQRNGGKLKPIGIATRAITPAQADRYALRAAQLLLVFVLSGILVEVLRLGDIAGNLVAFAITISAAIVLSKVPIDGVPMGLPQVGVGTRDLGTNVLWGLAGGIANFPIMLGLSFIGNVLFSGLPAPEHPLTTKLMEGQTGGYIALSMVLASICAPLFEEFLFRGHLFPALARVKGSLVYGAAVSSLLFAAIHPTGIPAWLPLAGVGAMGCFLSHQRGSLVPSIVMHATHNLLTLVMVLTLM